MNDALLLLEQALPKDIHAKYYNKNTYDKIANSNTSCFEAHVGFFRLLMKGFFGPYVL